MPTPKPAFILYSTLLSGISLFGIWICLFVALPKVIAWNRELLTGMVLWEPAAWIMEKSPVFVSLFWPFVGAFVAVFVMAILPFFPPILRAFSGVTLVVVSITTAALAAILYLSVFVIAHDIYFAQEHKTKIFAAALEEFALRESAEGRWEVVQERMAALATLSTKQIKSSRELSESDRRRRVAQLLNLLKTNSSPETKKQVLATLGLFREDLARDKSNEEFVRTTANGLTGLSFSSPQAFFDWLKTNTGKNGWNPLPIYAFSARDSGEGMPIRPPK